MFEEGPRTKYKPGFFNNVESVSLNSEEDNQFNFKQAGSVPVFYLG